ncbi:MAG: hypothetical protein QOD63_1194 [Actinomycetota bacterium]|nr:hypothetical protein [Actinomycetota bacterium]
MGQSIRIAILGAGGAGVGAALELAARGYEVDLYDENPEPVTRASRNNEGKIHLGILYAKDRTLRTATTMITGALHFAATLSRWIDLDEDTLALSTPFHYVVHKDTMVGVDDLERHYQECKRIFADIQDATGCSYLGLDRELLVEEIPRSQVEQLVDGRSVVTAFRTSERSIDPRPLAAALRGAVAAEPRIHFIGDAKVASVDPGGRERLRVTFEMDGETYHEWYDQVANMLWHGRLAIDAGRGLPQGRSWLYRYKFGNRVFVPLDAAAVPSITCVLGPFGDIVNFCDRGLYLSWYPIGMTATSRELRPPEWEESQSPAERYDVFRRSYDHWVTLCPALAGVDFSPDDVDPAGGVIFSWGATDIDNPDSELHQRHEIGVYTVGNYHTVNTGKFTMTPFFGLKTAERILGLS